MGRAKGGKKRGKQVKRAHHGGPLSRPGMRPKRKCCMSRPRCRRCPLRMLQEGTLPAGYGVRHRRLVKLSQ